MTLRDALILELEGAKEGVAHGIEREAKDHEYLVPGSNNWRNKVREGWMNRVLTIMSSIEAERDPLLNERPKRGEG
jgi:hypothetical protein